MADPHPMGNTRFTTEERKERITFYRDWTIQCYQMLGLDHWNIVVQFAPAQDGNKAECWRSMHQYQAKLRFADEWFDAEPEEQRQTVIHELLHCHMRPVWEAWEPLEGPLGLTGWHIFSKNMEVAEETAVDGLARALAPRFPFPPSWPPDPDAAPGGEALRIMATTIFTDGEESERAMSLKEGALRELAAAIAPYIAAAPPDTPNLTAGELPLPTDEEA